MRWFLLIAFACAVLVTCGREMLEEEVPLYAAAYGTLRTAAGAPVQGVQLRGVAFLDGCSGATVGVGYATTDSLGNYRMRITSLGGVQSSACIGVSTFGARNADSAWVSGVTVGFLRGAELGAEDSVQVDLRLSR